MWLLLALLFPFLEIYLLFLIAKFMGVMFSLMIVSASALIGVILFQYAGQKTLLQIQQNMRQGRVPAQQLLDKLMLFAASVLFVVPGVITDFLALLLLFPPTRKLGLKVFQVWLQKKMQNGSIVIVGESTFSGPPRPVQNERDAEVIDLQAIRAKKED